MSFADLADKVMENRHPKPPEAESFTTYYAGETIHPRFTEAFKWYSDFLTENVGPTYRSEVMLAGGALRSFFLGTPVKDWDIYLTPVVLKAMNKGETSDFFVNQYEWVKTRETDRSWVYKRIKYDMKKMKLHEIEMNIIKTPRENLSDIIKRYDFIVSMCAINSDAITFHPEYFIDLTAKILRINNPENPLSTLWRIQRYTADYGFTISKEELFRLTETIHEESSFPTLVKDATEKKKKQLENINAKQIHEIFPSS